MPGEEVYELYIDAFTPETIPMERLADYMASFAELLGYCEHVHVGLTVLNLDCAVPDGFRAQSEALLGAESAIQENARHIRKQTGVHVLIHRLRLRTSEIQRLFLGCKDSLPVILAWNHAHGR